MGEGDNKKALVLRQGSDIAWSSNRRSPVISRMSRDLLARSRTQELRTLRGDAHFANPELMALTLDDPCTG